MIAVKAEALNKNIKYIENDWRFIMRTMLASLIIFLFLISGCQTGTTTTRTAGGAGIGAAAGGAIGSMSGNFGKGAAIGAGVGAVSGFLYDQHKKGNID
jgi:hypothetical protein